MRDNPPISPPPLPSGISYMQRNNDVNEKNISITSPAKSQDGTSNNNQQQHAISSQHDNILRADDLGMLMLLVHECRIILYQDRRRFTRQELRNVSEDLAELAGERGAVSVQQQLRIISRMCRTFSFLSSGNPFSVEESLL